MKIDNNQNQTSYPEVIKRSASTLANVYKWRITSTADDFSKNPWKIAALLASMVAGTFTNLTIRPHLCSNFFCTLLAGQISGIAANLAATSVAVVAHELKKKHNS